MQRAAFIFLLLSAVSAVMADEGRELSAQALNESGFEKLEAGDPLSAERDFIMAIKYNPRVKFYYNNLAVSCMRQGRYSEAADYLQIALSIDPFYVKALSNMAVSSFRIYRFRQAYHYYSRSLSADPGYTEKKFEIDRVIREIELISARNPENQELSELLKYIKIKYAGI